MATVGGIGLTTIAGAAGFHLGSPSEASVAKSSSPGPLATGFMDCEVVTDPKHGADPTGAVDSTAAWQSAIDAAIRGCGQVWAPAGQYLINGEIVVNGPVSIRGVYTTRRGPESLGDHVAPQILADGTRLISTTNSGKFMMRVEPSDIESNSDGQIWGFSMSDVTFDGAVNHQRSDRGGLILRKVWSEISLERLRFQSMLREGIYFEQSQDGRLDSISIINVGTVESHAALAMEKNTNAIHAFGVHIESCPYLLRLGDATRHNQFMASKFELYSYGPSSPPVQIRDALENVFLGCQFVQRNTDDEYFYSGVAAPHMVFCDGEESFTSFTNCMFTTQPYHLRQQDANQGCRWIKSDKGVVKIIGGVIDTCWGGAGEPSIMLGSNCLFLGNSVYSHSSGGERNLMSLNEGNILDWNQFIANDPHEAIGKGVIFTCYGERNTFGPSNKIVGTVAAYLAGPSNQTVKEGDREIYDIPDGLTVPDVGWKTPGASKLFRCDYSKPTVIRGLVGAFMNDRITILFANDNHTLKNSEVLHLRSGKDTRPPGGSLMTFYFDGANWTENERSY
jgi:Pectate lyase superfamily protein